MPLAQSVLYNFLSEKNGLSAHFLEGQEIIKNMATIANVSAKGFSYMRDLVLSTKPLISFLSPNEGFGIYIDSESPYFRFKLEANQNGNFRTILLPQDLSTLPGELNGICRLTKVFTNQTPYTSVLELKKTKFSGVMEKILANSYQIDGHTYLSDKSDQSLMLVKIPPKHLNTDLIEEAKSHQSFWQENKDKINSFFEQAHFEAKSIIEFFHSMGFTYLGEKKVSFHCPCSREKMITGLKSLAMTNSEDLFEKEDTLETKCDYCQTYYQIRKEDLEDTI